uniref:Transposon Tf2-9 polyprotein n=1 Tax=Schistocephalus solidus TaxID=70667 RepID=A0A0X3NJL1_SCHSO
MKTGLSSCLLLTLFNSNVKIIVVADASNCEVSAVNSRLFPDNTEKARSLSCMKRNYGQIAKEALAIVRALKNFHFTLLLDPKPLLTLFGSKKNKACMCTSKILFSIG